MTRETVSGFDFDHIDRTTKINSLCDLVRRVAPIKVIDEEIEKCNLLCANCHHMKSNYELIVND